MVKKRVIKTPIKKVSETKEIVKEEKKEADFKNYLNVFEFDITLPGSGEKLLIKPLTTKDIKKLLQYEGVEDDFALMTQIFDDIIFQSVITEGFDLGELYLQDRFHLLLEIRKATKGAVHTFDYICVNEECESQSLKTIDLNKLPIKERPEIDNIIKLNDSIKVEMDLLKRKHEFEATEALRLITEKEKLSALQINAELALLLEAAGIKNIILPEGNQPNLSIFDKKYFIEHIPKFMHKMIQDWYEDSDFGTDFKISVQCEHCGDKQEQEITYNNFFF